MRNDRERERGGEERETGQKKKQESDKERKRKSERRNIVGTRTARLRNRRRMKGREV